MFMDCQSYHCQNEHASKYNVQIPQDPSKPIKFSIELNKKNSLKLTLKH